MRVGGALIFSRGLGAANTQNFDTHYIFVEHSIIQFYDALSHSVEFCFNSMKQASFRVSRVNTETCVKKIIYPQNHMAKIGTPPCSGF